MNDDRDKLFFNLSTTRLEALSDGVFAIAMTLLVLELSVPHFIGAGNTGYPTSFSEMWGEFYTYGVGFFSLGVYWILHHYIFNFIKKSDGALVWLNITFLAFASLVPFWTQVLLYSDLPKTAFSYYCIYMVVTFLILLSILYYATFGYRLVDPDVDKPTISILKRIILIGTLMMVIVALSSYYSVHTWIGNLVVVPAAFFIISTIYISRRTRKQLR